jgi:hypothetical protein
MKGKLPAVMGLLFFLVLPIFSGDKNDIVKIGPFFSLGECGELSLASLVAPGALGMDVAIRAAEKIEIWGSYKFNKMKTPIGHGYADIFRLDAFAAGLLYVPFRIQGFEPFAGVGLNYYHFTDGGEGDDSTYFILPLKSAVGPYIQAGSYFRFISRVKIQGFVKYNLVKGTVKRTTDWGTYHYRTDFSGFEFGLGILVCIHGK